MPGNAGIARDGVECLPAGDVVAAAKERDVDLVVVGPEAPLVEGLVDDLAAADIAAFGPKQAMPAVAHSSARPATSGASGPTTTRSIPANSPWGRISASCAIPALPGVANTCGRCGERLRARTIACSRPPPPTTRTRGVKAPG
jgi:hypothetical protein